MTDIITLFNQWLIENDCPPIVWNNIYLGGPLSREMMGNPMTDEEVLAHFDKVHKESKCEDPSKGITDLIDRLEKELNISQEETEEFNRIFEELRKELGEGKK